MRTGRGDGKPNRANKKRRQRPNRHAAPSTVGQVARGGQKVCGVWDTVINQLLTREREGGRGERERGVNLPAVAAV